jgi:hypothetical protein
LTINREAKSYQNILIHYCNKFALHEEESIHVKGCSQSVAILVPWIEI